MARDPMFIPMFGYMRLSLVGDRQGEVVDEFEVLARQHGGTVHEVFREKGSPVQLLWSLVGQADEELHRQLVPHLHEIAARRRIGLGQVVNSAPPTPALWMLVAALASCAGDPSYLFVPSIRHFDDLGVPRDTVLQCVSQIAPAASIVYLDSGGLGDFGEVGGLVPLRECRPDNDREGLLVHVEVNCFADAEEVVRVKSDRGLARAGLSDMVDQVAALMHKLVSEAAGDITADSNTLTIQMLQQPGAASLIVEMWESHRHERSVSEALLAIVGMEIGGTVERCHSATGGTVTRCQLPLARTEQDTGADTVELPSLQQSPTQLRSAS
ncbi:hypothetical protein [Nocardia asiatica]|uniref:hypothetical protein n=1 Tax=Nocardia asiatica TaxID=209252 RepID=UPI0024581FF7|nr:hypothetical protein [Nocardia asiatica]